MRLSHSYLTTTILFLSFYSIIVRSRAQSPATAPAPPGPVNVTKVLEKAGQFTTLIRLLKTTQVADQINTQLNNSNTGMTLFAPTDNAFSSLPPGTLNSITDQQKVSLLQYHVLPTFLSVTQFQTVSNPLRTQAGDSSGQFPLNVTTNGNQVNITTGLVNTTVSNTLYSDNQLAVYQVDKVLLPLQIFRPSAPAPAPAASKPAKDGGGGSSSDSSTGSSSKDSSNDSGADRLDVRVSQSLVTAAAAALVWCMLSKGIELFFGINGAILVSCTTRHLKNKGSVLPSSSHKIGKLHRARKSTPQKSDETSLQYSRRTFIFPHVLAIAIYICRNYKFPIELHIHGCLFERRLCEKKCTQLNRLKSPDLDAVLLAERSIYRMMV